MPLYEYDCEGCGPFNAARPMAESAAPHPCPECETLAPRMLSASFVARGGGQRRATPEPRLVRRRHDPERAAAKPKRSAPSSQRPSPHHHGRPWMVGH